MSPSLTTLSGILIATLLLVQASPLAIQKRADVTWYHQKEFFTKYYWDIWFTCFYPYNDMTDEGCLSATDNKDWVAFTYDTPSNPATYVWLEDDARTANCLFDLHHLQKDECISVKGSKCEATKGTSKILNARVHGDLGSITTNETVAIQFGSWAIVGSKVNSNQDDYIKHMPSGVQFLYIPDRASWKLPTTIKEASYISVVFGGAEQC